jgi:DeoR family transcriptional regulator, aga operon transcriptional repressor
MAGGRGASVPHAALPSSARREQMCALINERQFARVTELSERFGVSEVTVRSDLEALDARGLVRRVRGGALPRTLNPVEQSFERTEEVGAVAKRSIGHAAARMVQPGHTVTLDASTTSAAIARSLAARSDLHDVAVITNGLKVALLLEAAIPRLTVVVAGGTLRPLQHSLVDPMALRTLEGLHADIAFVGCSGVDPEHGVTSGNLAEAEVKQRMLRSAQRRVVAADGSAVGRVAVVRVCEISELDLLLSDGSADPEVVAALSQHGLAVHLADHLP